MDNLEVKVESFEYNCCRECGETFNEWTELVNHRENSHNHYTCKTCTKEEITIKDFEYHLQIHGGFKLFKCIICNENFSFLCELNDHLPKHLSEVTDLKKIEYPEVSEAHDEHCSQDIEIKIEDLEDSHNESNNLVEDSFSEIKPVKIAEERKSFELIEIDQVHKIKRGRPKKTDLPCLKLEKRFKCPHCPKTTKTATSLKVHIRTHTGERPYECAYCGRCYFQKCALKIHITMKHDRNKKKTEVCQICGKAFYVVRRLKEHIREFHKKPREKYPCSICGKTYSKQHTVELHMTNAHSKSSETFPCLKCNKIFDTHHKMMQHHRQNHIYANKHKCNWKSCEYSTYSPSTLRQHQRIHTGEKPFSCKMCNKIFSTRNSLSIHTARHGAPMHQCNFCEKSFKVRQSLKKHVQRVHEERKFPCFQCEKKFASNADAMRHMRYIHSIENKDNIEKQPL